MYRESERRIDLQSIKKNWPHHIDKLTNKNRNHRKCIYERLQTQRERNEEKKKQAIEKGGGGESENTIERENKNWLK